MPFAERRVIAGLRGKIVEHVAGCGPSSIPPAWPPAGVIKFRVVHVAGDVIKLAQKLVHSSASKGESSEELLHRLVHFSRNARRPMGVREIPDDGEIRRQSPVVGQPVERGHQFSLGEIAIGAEDHDGAFRHTAVEAQAGLAKGSERPLGSTYHVRIESISCPKKFRAVIQGPVFHRKNK